MKQILFLTLIVALLGCDTVENDPYAYIGEMVLVKALGSTFSMGEDGVDNADPVHNVSFSYDFEIRKTEVVQKEFDDVMSHPEHGFENYITPFDTNGTFETGEKFPAFLVSWYEAALFCNALSKSKGYDTVYSYDSLIGIPGDGAELTGLSINLAVLGYRLPTEAEWEYSCRGGSSTGYYWNKDFAPYPETQIDTAEVSGYAVWRVNSNDLGYGNTGYGPQEVGNKKENDFKLKGMCGNVSEWCNDWWDKDAYEGGDKSDVKGPLSGTFRVVRGGNWSSFVDKLRSSERKEFAPDTKSSHVGFRYVLNDNIPESWE